MKEGWYRIVCKEDIRSGVIRSQGPTLTTGWVDVYAERSFELVDQVPVGGLVRVLGLAQTVEPGLARRDIVLTDVPARGRIRLRLPAVSMTEILDAELAGLRGKWAEESEWVERDWLEKERELPELLAWRVAEEDHEASWPQPRREKWLKRLWTRQSAISQEWSQWLEELEDEGRRVLQQQALEADQLEEVRWQEVQELLARQEEEKRRIVRMLAFLLLKASAGLLKLLCEDVVHTFVQLVFAIKCWEELSGQMKAFTLASLSAGLAVSTAGPVKELWKLWRKWPNAAQAGITVADFSNSIFAQEPEQPGDGDDEPLLDVATGIEDVDVVGFLLDPNQRHYHSTQAYRGLLACAIGYWAGMACVPILFGSSIKGVTLKDEGNATSNGDSKGEGDPNVFVPTSAVLFFGVITQAIMFVELWVANHTLRGFRLLRDCGESMRDAFQDMSKAEPLLSVVLGFIARYDTFSDVVFTIVVMKTDPITELKFPKTLGQTIPLPCPLHRVALVALLGGVFLAQGLLGIYLLVAKKHMACALKLNEFCLLLALSELDSAPEGHA